MLVLESLFNKAAGLQALLKRASYKCFLVRFAKFLRTPILKNICELMLLYKNNLFFC